jgi:hypothetical protein
MKKDYFRIEFRFFESKPGNENEKGIRCETGAVPAAVSPLKGSLNQKPLPVDKPGGKVQKTGRARRPAVFQLHNFLLSGKIAKMKCHFLSFILPII